ncbi:MAG: tyrosine-type recombinase/integrase [Leptothrix sp. (in: b-proteobacteria)]
MGIISDKAMQAKPGDRDTWLIEDGARGTGRLVGRITPSGTRTFYYRYTNADGARIRLPIGPYDARGDGTTGFTVQQARFKARELSALHRTGVKDLREHLQKEAEDVRLAEEAERQAAIEATRQAELENQRRLTIRQLFDRWRATELQPALRADNKRTGRKDGGAYVQQQFERHVFPSIGDCAIQDVRKSDVLTIIDTQKTKGQLRTAAVLLSDLRQMLGFALDRELIEIDPLATIKKARIVGVAVSRDRVLAEDEIRLLAAALPNARMSVRSETAIWILLATGARIGELMGTVWSDALPQDKKLAQGHLDELQARAEEDGAKVGILNLAERKWHLPDTKNQRSHTIHLSEFAVERFKRLLAIREPLPDSTQLSPWVFPARDSSHPVCVKSFGKQISDRQREPDQRMSGRSKNTEALMLPGGKWTAHDLRRTAGTLMASMGISGDVIDECLNHMIESRVRRTYIKDRREVAQAHAFDALGDRLAMLISGAQPSSNVVELKVKTA